LHVVQDLALFIPDAVAVAPPIAAPVEQFTAAAREALERVAKTENLEHLTVHREVREGTPFYEIIRFAKEKDIDLIVMGTHGRTGLERLLMGSVAEKVMRESPCSVLVVKLPKAITVPERDVAVVTSPA
jgi:universal stress protein A